MRIVTVACILTIALLSCTQPTEPVQAVTEPAQEEPAEEPTEEPQPEEPAEEPAPEPEPTAPEEPAEPEEPASSPEIPDDSEPEEPAPEPEPEPAWQPEPHTVYILDGEGGIYLQSTTDDPDLFRSKCSAWEGAAESYNRKRSKPGPYPYSFVAGDPPGDI